MTEHPIRKMLTACGKAPSERQELLAIARHVKPLLDALDKAHDHMNHRAGLGYEPCEYCRLLAEWRRPL